MKFSEEEINNVKVAYEKLYLKSRELNLSKKQQDDMLDKLVNELFMESLDKLKHEDENVSEEENQKVFKSLNNLIKQWKKDMERKGLGS